MKRHLQLFKVVMGLFLAGLFLAGPAVVPVQAGPVAEVEVQAAPGPTPTTFGFGGGVWRVPKVARLAEPLLTALGEGGTWRVALAWEVLAAAERPEDVTRLLQSYPLNDFLEARARAGGQIIVTLDAMPRFLARETGTKPLADGPLWARSATDDLAGWADVAERVARHFHGLGISAIYEVWNEPDHAFRGSLDDYVALYRATALGVLRADPGGRIAGPALSDWGSVIHGERFVAGFLARAAATPLPELGLDRLPVDAVTYHAFSRVPGRHHARVLAEARGMLAAAGYGTVPLICSEWNVAAQPPYPEGDLNGTYPGAAHAAATMIAMAGAGLAGQVFQMAVDPGSAGYSAGVLTAAGTPRPVWHAFDMAAEAARLGPARAANSSDPVVQVAAFHGGSQLAVLLAVMPPTDLMLARDAMEPVAFDQPDVFSAIVAAGPESLAAFMFRNGEVPQGLSPAAVAALKAGREVLRTDQAAREPWRNGGTVHLVLPEPMQLVSHRVLDASTAATPESIAQSDRDTNTALRDLLGLAEHALRDQMTTANETSLRRYGDALAQRLDGRAELAGNAALAQIDQEWVVPVQTRLADLLAAQRARTVRPVTDASDQKTLDLAVEPYSVHLLLFQAAAP
ncbi:GH39 family glycosyl hydrolase [Rhodobacter ferrooxidans]|uniref:Glycoside hydrolase family 39 n=1 Tax=Rhodobacter ferrooxidans TaxID=371731 RepID=C8S4A6_9RHOB|nr:glycoside hydrolase family 39 [Rhodobacter sp. SW2]EEW24165.1 glycoside hydrolase family 39 [Rhodobacter sp. SW2]